MKNHYVSSRLTRVFIFTFTLFILSFSAKGQVDVTATGGTLSQSYTTLGAAFDAINAGTHTGVINIGISISTSEGSRKDSLVASGTGAASYTSILIRPTGGAARTISGATTAGIAMIELQG